MVVIRGRLSSTSPFRDGCCQNVLSAAAREPSLLSDSRSLSSPSHDNDHTSFRSIQILPTIDEIISTKPVYLPKKNQQSKNNLTVGPERHLDLMFRHLRHESVESIRDICHSAAQKSFLQEEQSITMEQIKDQIRHETKAGNRYFLYENVQVEEIQAHEHKSILVRLSYDCPRTMRGNMIHKSGRLEEGMLVALLGLDCYTNQLMVHFLEIYSAQSTMSMNARQGEGRRAAIQASFPEETSEEQILQIFRFAHRLCPEVKFALVELPKVLLAGFRNCLHRLQHLSSNDVSFLDYIAPEIDPLTLSDRKQIYVATKQRPVALCSPPKYALDEEFRYDLSSILKPGKILDLHLSLAQLREPQSLQTLKDVTALDEGQATAFHDLLTREFSFCQGPPGCGKPYLGVQLARVLLASRTSAKPILVVCLTNHALDSFMADLKEVGVGNLLRIGSGSKEEWTKPINLKERSRKYRFSYVENQAMEELQTNSKVLFAQVDAHCQGLSGETLDGRPNWHAIRSIVQEHYPKIFDQFQLTTESDYAQAFAFNYWASGGDLENLRNLQHELTVQYKTTSAQHGVKLAIDADEVLENMFLTATYHNQQAGAESIWNLGLSDRAVLVQEWQAKVNLEQQARKLLASYTRHKAIRNEVSSMVNAKNVRTLKAHDVIGITTTACASRWNTLRALDIEIMICEEAGEVMEPHALCMLFPTIQHAIMIGDPLQLRPEVSERELSLEQKSDYRLDESLFERMIMPHDPTATIVPVSHLTIQRRMHPDIADIARLTYPYLIDHETTALHPPALGLEERMFWWDHRMPELAATGVHKSHTNEHEIGMITGLVEHLLNGSAYLPGDIAVVTPYSGQLALLNKALSTTCTVWLSDRDRECLLDESLLQTTEDKPRARDEIAMCEMLRIATVDNFQGEEAKIVILTTVRSGGSAGFLKILNRINVACSRARDGFIIIGNSETLSQVPMWRNILTVFDTRRGFDIVTCCSNHANYRHSVRNPTAFANISKCSEKCETILKCGHVCEELCHAMELHERELIPCKAICTKILDCGHQCLKSCSVPCGICQITVSQTILKCGHIGASLCSVDQPECSHLLGNLHLPCGHIKQMLCKDSATAGVCFDKCSATLTCGHKCSGLCGSCQHSGHGTCEAQHAKILPCGHVCKARCHDSQCPPCSELLKTTCKHGSRKRLCHEPQSLCLKLVQAGTEPTNDNRSLCCFPNIALPTSEPCSKLLGCSHKCPSLRSEGCIPKELCSQCAAGKSASAVIYMPECEHVVSVNELDARNFMQIFNIDSSGNFVIRNVLPVEVIPPSCICGVVSSQVQRYKVLNDLLSYGSLLKEVVSTVHHKLSRYSSLVGILERQLDASLGIFKQEIRPNPLAAKANTKAILNRGRALVDHKNQIVRYRSQVTDILEHAAERLHGQFSSLPKYQFMLHLHLNVLEFRSMNAHLRDKVCVAKYLKSLSDFSGETSRVGARLLQSVEKEANVYINLASQAQVYAKTRNCPWLDCESGLHAVQFFLLASDAKAQFGLETPSASIDNTADSLAKLVEYKGVARKYTSTSKGLLNSISEFEMALISLEKGFSPSTVPRIDYASAKQIEKSFAEYKASEIVSCDKMHPYSAKVFPGGCPYCSEEAKTEDDKFREAEKNLYESEFLKMICGRPMTRTASIDIIADDPRNPLKNECSVENAESEITAANTVNNNKVLEVETTPILDTSTTYRGTMGGTTVEETTMQGPQYKDEQDTNQHTFTVEATPSNELFEPGSDILKDNPSTNERALGARLVAGVASDTGTKKDEKMKNIIKDKTAVEAKNTSEIKSASNIGIDRMGKSVAEVSLEEKFLEAMRKL